MQTGSHPLLSLIGVGAVLVGAPDATAQDVEFQLLRYEDDLTTARARAIEGSSSVKAIPIGGAAWLSLGGELRMRFERTSAPGLGAAGPDDEYGLHRALVHADLQTTARVRFFGQLGAYVAPKKENAAPPAEDAVDLQQAFVDLSTRAGSGDFVFRAGRQELALGSQRLVGLRDGPNARLSFDGARLMYVRNQSNIDFLLLRPVAQIDGVFNNRSTRESSLSGIYSTLTSIPFPGSLDVYLLRYERPNAAFSAARGAERRWSGGVRLHGRDARWDWNTELTIQGGDVGRQTVKAWGLATDTGATLAFDDYNIRVGARVNFSSGDRRASDGELNTGNAYYPRLPYLGSAATFAPSNMIDVHPELTLAKGRGTLTIGYQAIWRMTTADAVYVSPLIALPGTAGHGGRFTAHQWSLDAAWRASSAWRLDAALAWVDASSALESLDADDSAIAFASFTWRF